MKKIYYDPKTKSFVEEKEPKKRVPLASETYRNYPQADRHGTEYYEPKNWEKNPNK